MQTLHLSNGSTLQDGDLVMGGSLQGGGVASLALTDSSTLDFDWNGDGIADLTLKFMATPAFIVYDAVHGDFVIG
jgi:2-keto-4-pentenoate hydratase/2-oxohepta-3-ene-1,7-dioic acid hydratase in catechol pathway